MRTPVIRADEGLILKTDRQEYEGKCGPFDTIDDVLAYCDDRTLVILHDTGDRTLDLTEDFAGYWLDRHSDTTEDDFVPPFVRHSMNYEIFIDELEQPSGWAGVHMEAGRA
ncbi:MAG: hypothetical protein AAAB35_10340 [Phyllobacterium sp.]|uniref:hypothetical protein n=1 Tax=Phyllobacterium sp. TaxID=1871046 RepID=UPI0030F164A9